MSVCPALTIRSANRKRRPLELLFASSVFSWRDPTGHGFFARIPRSVFRVVTRSWHMYPVGFRFGLGLIGARR
ncbi:hypothetical protein [Mesorhizobium sp. M1340]|uniref:HoxN/HupN/NixA family nickel/cobalt transporter n=1 Tax=Mesorhizobium sp. M1340 TaxID=2957087 RepID=UPI003336B608